MEMQPEWVDFTPKRIGDPRQIVRGWDWRGEKIAAAIHLTQYTRPAILTGTQLDPGRGSRWQRPNSDTDAE